MNLPNYITIFRICLIPIFVLVFYMPFDWSHATSAFIFALASLTDWLDGYLARIWKQTSDLGKFLDPVADKLVVAIALIMIVSKQSMPFLALPAMVIIGREIIISALREWMSEIGKRTSVAVNYIGKLKTLIQMLAVVFLLAYNPDTNKVVGALGFILLYVAAGLTLWSMVMYINAAWPEFSLRKI